MEAKMYPYLPWEDDQEKHSLARGTRGLEISFVRVKEVPKALAELEAAMLVSETESRQLADDIDSLLIDLEQLHIPPVSWPLDNDEISEAMEMVARLRKMQGRLGRIANRKARKPPPAGEGGDKAAVNLSNDDPAMIALTPDEQAFLDALTDEGQSGPDLVAKLLRDRMGKWDESKISKMWKRPKLHARGVRHEKKAGYYRIGLQGNSNVTAR
jgi:hypothetical protein